MIDPKVFAELQNRGIVTQVGIEACDFKNLEELKNYGLATSIATDEVYAKAVEATNYMETFLAEVAAGGVVTLDADLTLSAPITIEKDVTIDLNGYTLTNTPWDEDGESNTYMFWVKKGKLTLTGNGNVVVPDAVYSMAVWANGGDVEINGGTYKNGGDSCDLIYASKAGKVEINGGEFVATGPASGNAPGTKNPYSALNIKDANKSTCSITVKGGKFFKFNPADNLSENPKMNFVADGYVSVAEGDWYVVKEDSIVVDEVTE
jgi:hypothetical protein